MKHEEIEKVFSVIGQDKSVDLAVMAAKAKNEDALVLEIKGKTSDVVNVLADAAAIMSRNFKSTEGFLQCFNAAVIAKLAMKNGAVMAAKEFEEKQDKENDDALDAALDIMGASE